MELPIRELAVFDGLGSDDLVTEDPCEVLRIDAFALTMVSICWTQPGPSISPCSIHLKATTGSAVANCCAAAAEQFE
ncbi:hypothetical protein [Mycobacterium uberis]|uniref:hypothetical protein n=1 Tax=Mycobacterium uberis TaxID=2162698 RepID=UPI0014030E5C|nr:hypothetical protein [Mycobacterium uberis]